MTVQNPHNHFFRESFSRREIVEEFIKQELPKAISQTFDFESLHPIPSSFIDPELIEYQSDRSERQVIIDMVKAQGTQGDHLITTIKEEE